jgi:nuclear transport factor 2 (NTF2) superfamily protein
MMSDERETSAAQIDYDSLMRANLARVFGERDAERRRAAVGDLYAADAVHSGACVEAPCVRPPANESTDMETKPPFPPFTLESAKQKVRMAEDAWNSRDPQRVSLAYTMDTYWRNRAEFATGREQVQQFLTRKWARELDYRLIKELWLHDGNRIAVRFAYEWHDDSSHWYRSYGNENWEFDHHGLMKRRFASINDLPILQSDRKFFWPLGRRPDDHPGLSDLGL